MKTTAVDFVVYNVSDYKKGVAFYQDVLGLKMSSEWPGQWAEFDAGNVTLALCVWGKNIATDGQKGGAYVALAVDDFDEALAELKTKGIALAEGPHESPVCHMVGITDPDGNMVLLHRRKDGSHG